MKKIKSNHYKGLIISLGIIVLSIISIMMQEYQRKRSYQIDNRNIATKENEIAVYITGAVKNPGVYYLKLGARLCDLLDLCGGISENADIKNINLAKKLSDADKIEISPIKEQDADMTEDLGESEAKVNINQATLSELMTLNGIGEATAKKIIEYRQIQKFVTIEDIMEVTGIGENKYQQIKENICVE